MTILFALLINFSLAKMTKDEIYFIKCMTICEQDSDELGLVIKGQCYCANKRKIDFIPTKINRNMELNVLIDKKPSYSEY